MSEQETIQAAIPSPDEISDEERKKREQSGIASLLRSVLEKERREWYQQFEDEVAKLDTSIDRSSVPNLVNKTGEPVARFRSPTEPIYRQMSEDEQEWRNPDADHYYAEWIRGHFSKDTARMWEAESKLTQMFGRATTTEGTAGASGALSTGTGGALIPRPLENVVLIARDRRAKMRRFATIYQMTRQQHTIPTAASMTAAMVGEGTTAAQGEPTFASVALVAKDGQVKAIASKQILSDAAVNLVNIYARRAGSALGVLEDDQFFADGDGTGNNISAFLSGTAYSETTSGILSHTDLIGIAYTLTEAYLDNARWLVAGNVLQLLAALKDGNGRPFYQGLQERPAAIGDDAGMAVGTLLGYPVHRVPFAAGTIWFGDPAACYAVGSRAGIETEASEHVKFDLRQVMWLFTQRFDGNNVDTSAGQVATGITSVNTL